jgi:hypothetical protein
MVTLRCTQKLLRRLAVPGNVEIQAPTTVLGDWYANLYFSRPQLVLCMNERTLLLVLVPARDARSLGPRFREAALAHLLRLGVPSHAVQSEARAMSNVAFGRTASQRVLGCLREAAFALSFESERPRFRTLAELELHFSEYIYSTTGYRQPRALALELFAATGVTFGATAPQVH